MTSRPRTAKKAATEPTTPPAKRTVKKTTAKRTTGGGTARKRTPRKPAADIPALTLVSPNAKAEDTTTQVDPRPRLTVRRRLFVGPMGAHEQAAIRAARDSAALFLPIPVRAWNGSEAQLTDGTLLIHNPGPDPDHPNHTGHRVFTAQIACRHGAIHGWPIASADDLKEARAVTRTCGTPHAEPTTDDDGIHEYDWDKAISRGIPVVAQPKPSVVLQLAEGVRRAKASADKTQPLDQAEIAEGLAQRAAEQPADNDQTREHPQP